MNILDFIIGLMPQDPMLGPPLPKLLGITWPWLQSTESFLPLLPFMSSPETSYENEELIEWVDWRGRERKVKITRKARRQ